MNNSMKKRNPNVIMITILELCQGIGANLQKVETLAGLQHNLALKYINIAKEKGLLNKESHWGGRYTLTPLGEEAIQDLRKAESWL
jgi:predicted transcriptional regulator